MRAGAVRSGLAALAMAGLAATPALADNFTFQNADGTISVTGGVGLMWIRADEYVFMNTDDEDLLSYLKWESTAVPVLDGTVEVELARRFYLKGTFETAMGGNGYMEDYDWIEPFATGTGPHDWSHRSQHGTTDLDHFFGGSLALGYRLVDQDRLRLGLIGGAQYRDVKWTAYGGNYIYSDMGLHDDVFTAADSTRVISYQQRVPAAFLGLDLQSSHGRWTFAASAKGGVTIGATAIDDHWQRPLFFREDVDAGPTLALAASVSYALSTRFSASLGASFDPLFKARSDSQTFDPISGVTTYDESLTGTGQRTFKLTAGLKGRF